MEDAQNEIVDQIDELNALMRNFDVVDVDSETIDDYKEKLAKIDDLFVKTDKDITKFVRKYSNNGLDAQSSQAWNGQLSKLQSDVRSHRDRIKAKVIQVRASTSANTNDGLDAKKLELELLARQVVAQEAISNSNTQQINQTLREADAKRCNSLVKAKAKAASIRADVEELDKAINETRDWKNATDITVKRAMRNIKEWKKEIIKIIEAKREFLILVDENEFTDEDDDVSKDLVDRVVTDLKEDVEAMIVAIKNEDNIRALYTLDITPVADPVKLPKFAGKDGEDFHQFREEMNRGFIQNRISIADQLPKLRECLSGAALALVPKSTITTVDEAWTVLKKSYGDAYRIIKFRKEELMKVGKFPKLNERNKGGYNQQIAWYLKVENLLKGILDLGKNHPEYSDAAFSIEFLSTVAMMFPQRISEKLYDCGGQRDVRLQNMLSQIVIFREKAQGMQVFMEASSPQTTVGNGGSGGSGGGNPQQHSQVTGGGRHGVIQGLIAYKPPRRDENCRICNMLETEGDTDNLYDDHIHNFPTGCPRYINMTMKQRADIARKAKLCLNCHDPEYTYKGVDRNHSCSKGKKSRYTCTNSSCR